jgi:hypothetical protein
LKKSYYFYISEIFKKIIGDDNRILKMKIF